ncbi:MAG: NAD-dependent epimerase/dehydratase family protein [Acidimicrobiales bacterium]|nr:NAD-dependent epimerase/dehydratase family protein [Acidimicrobiales bacterium]MDG1846414.1 NAD-dependent epimerase/dehydratase family protein [Acidimicrobiales bacterium]
MTKKTVLITGGAGFIGSALADRLLGKGYNVAVVDNFTTGRRDNLVERPGLEILEGSISDQKLMADFFSKVNPDVVVHAAASYKDPEAWVEDSETNVVGTSIIVNEAKKAEVERFIYFQTALCYGLHPEEQPIPIDHELRPRESSYAISKTAGENYLALSGLNWVSFRLANGYGPRNITGPLPTFFQRLSNGSSVFVMDTRRDFIFIEDLVDVVERAVDGEGEPGPYHVSSGSDVSIEELLQATLKAVGIQLEEPVEVRPRGEDDAFTILLDPSRTHEQFPGWEAKTPLQDGVDRAVGYYREFGIEETFTHLHMPDDDS